MSLSMYQASVPVFLRAFNNLSAILDKTTAHAEAKKIDPAVLIGSRLAPDMLPFSSQVQIAADTAKGCAARLAGVEIPKFADIEKTFAELKERMSKTVAFVQSIKPEQFDGSSRRTIVMKLRGGDVTFTGQSYLLTFVLPNFFFHVTTAYDILRHNGVGLGKLDYLGRD